MHPEVANWSSQWRRLALQTALEGRYLDAVIFGRVESSLHLLVWIIHCAAIGVQEARRRPWFFPPKISLPA